MYSIGYWYGGKLVDNGTIEIGDMYLCMFALPIGAMSPLIDHRHRLVNGKYILNLWPILYLLKQNMD